MEFTWSHHVNSQVLGTEARRVRDLLPVTYVSVVADVRMFQPLCQVLGFTDM